MKLSLFLIEFGLKTQGTYSLICLDAGSGWRGGATLLFDMKVFACGFTKCLL